MTQSSQTMSSEVHQRSSLTSPLHASYRRIYGYPVCKMSPFSAACSRAANSFLAIKPTFPRIPFSRIKPFLPRPTFILLHWTYILTISIVSSIILWCSSTPRGSVAYVDSLFLIVAATTQAGLNTINLGSLNTFQQCVILLHIIIGNPIFVSAFVVHVRKHAFHRRFKKIAKENEALEKSQSSGDNLLHLDLEQTQRTLGSAASELELALPTVD